MNLDFTNVTEQPGHNATNYQMSAMMTRYDFAAKMSNGKDILEVACGSGTGLDFLSQDATSVVGCDIDQALVDIAASNHLDNHKVKVLQCDAQNLPFDDNTFDMVLLYEAIYYLPNVNEFLEETKRVLRPGGEIIIVTVNREWHGFNQSPFSVKYYSVNELTSLFKQNNITPSVKLAYFDEPGGASSAIISIIRKIAVTLRLIPNTMEGKEKLKRLFYGKLQPIPAKIYQGWAEVTSLVNYDESINLENYKVLYITGKI
jgi:ubiquinone/menaquinone biosynthesis C-methylase UbiE